MTQKLLKLTYSKEIKMQRNDVLHTHTQQSNLTSDGSDKVLKQLV